MIGVSKFLPSIALPFLCIGLTYGETKLVGGSPVPAEDPIAKFTVQVSNLDSICSGTLITPRVVLTAAHCLVSHRTLKAYANPHVISVRFNSEELPIFAERIRVPADYVLPHGNGLASNAAKSHDIGLILLSEEAPSGFTPIYLAEREDIPPYGKTLLTLAGYGLELHSSAAVSGRLNAGRAALNPKTHFYPRPFLMGDVSAELGDSGGPCLVDSPSGGYKVAGAISSHFNLTDDLETYFTDVSFVTDYTAFLVETMGQFGLDPTSLYSSGKTPN